MRRYFVLAFLFAGMHLGAATTHGQTVGNFGTVVGPNNPPLVFAAPGIVNSPKIEAAYTTVFPVAGLFNTYFDDSAGTTIGYLRPVGVTRPMRIGGWWQPVVGLSFQYDHFFGRDDIQVNTLSRNLRIDGANAYTGAFTLGVQHVFPIGRHFLYGGLGLSGRAGGIAVNEQPLAFDPARRVGRPTFDYEDDGALVGYRVEAWLGLQSRKGIAFFVKKAFGNDWTDAILGNTHSSGSFTLSVGVAVPLGSRTLETPWVAQRRAMTPVLP